MGIFTDGRQTSSLGSTRRDSPIHCCYLSWLRLRELHTHAHRPSSNPQINTVRWDTQVFLRPKALCVLNTQNDL